MKKILSLLLAAAMLLSFSTLAFADDASPYQIVNGDFETGDLTGWTVPDNWARDEEGNPLGVISAESYWAEEMPYNQGGQYHLDGWNNGIPEGETWAIQSSPFTLGGSGFITLRMGGNSAAVRVYKTDGSLIGAYTQTRFHDAGFPRLANGGSWADMGTYVIDLHEYLGEELYIELRDEKVGAWAQAFFDEVITYYETAPDWQNLADTVKDGGTDETVDIPWTLAENKADEILNPPPPPPPPTDPWYVPEAPNKYSVINGGFETGTTAGWTPVSGSWATDQFGHPVGVISAATYWGEEMPYNQAGNYHLDGWNNGIPEGDTWALRSSTFTLGGTGMISVRMGGNAAAVRIYKADGTLIGHYKQTRFNDQNFPSVGAGGSWADMGTYVMDLSEYLGEDLYIELCDEPANGWAQAFFDEVVTYYEEAPDYENLSDTVKDGGSSEQVEIPWTLADNLEKPAEEPEDPGEYNIVNPGFETGDLTGWTPSSGNWGDNPTGVISAETYWGEGMPYNQAGNYHLDGWNTGIPEGETWSIRSTLFTLGGSGFMSVRMGGNAAAVRVYTEDNTLIGYFQQTRFNDANFPHLAEGGSWADMGTYVMDMSAYLGQKLVIELCDEPANGWAQAFFDEVVTYYEEAPDWQNMSDTVKDGGTGEEVEIPWQLAENLAPAPAGGDSAEPGQETETAPTEEPEAAPAEAPAEAAPETAAEP